MMMSAAKAIVLFVAGVNVVLASEDETQTDVASPKHGIENKSACAKEFLEWCRNRSESSANNFGISILSEGRSEKDQQIRTVCIANSTQINCTRNDLPWFICDTNGNVLYKGEGLKPDAQEDGICDTKNHAKRMFGPHTITFDQTEFENSMKIFSDRILEFQKRMKSFSKGFMIPKPNHFGESGDP